MLSRFESSLGGEIKVATLFKTQTLKHKIMLNFFKNKKEEKLFFTREEIKQQFTKRGNFHIGYTPIKDNESNFRFWIRPNEKLKKIGDIKKDVLKKLNEGIDTSFYGNTYIDEERIKISIGGLANEMDVFIEVVYSNSLNTEVDEELQELIKYAIEKNDNPLKNKIETIIKKKLHSRNFSRDIS